MKKVLQFCLFSILSCHSMADILFRGDFESGRIYPLSSGTTDSFYYAAFAPGCAFSNKDYSSSNDNRVVTNPTRYGNYANAQTIHFDCDYRPLNNDKYQKPRQENKVMPRSLKVSQGKEYWIAFSVLLPGNWIFDYDGNPDNLFQIFKEKTSLTSSPRDSGPAPISLTAVGDEYRLGIRDRHDSNGNPISDKRIQWKINRGEWQDIVINMRPCRKGLGSCNGFVKVYLGNTERRSKGIHRNPIYTDTGYNTESDLHTIAVNLYKHSWHCNSSFTINGVKYSRANYEKCMKNTNPTRDKGSRTVFFDELVVSNGRGSINEVAPYFGGCSGSCSSGGTSANETDDSAFNPLPPRKPEIR